MILDFLQKLELKPHQIIVVGLSGGPDSVALVHLLAEYQNIFNYRLIAAHLDHEWRVNSHQDMLFCQNLCKKLNIELICKKANELPDFKTIQANGSKEALGRNLRRAFFNEIINNSQASYIALGHHLDDQIETFFIRLIRGSSLSGLGCMQTKNENYIRPLLNITKIEILEYLNKHHLDYVIDSTNESDLFLRNKIRKLLPEVNKLDTRFKPNFIKIIHKIQRAKHFITNLAQTELNKIMINQQLDLKLFNKLDHFLQQEVLLQWLYQNQVKFTQTDKFITEILRFFKTTHGGTHKICSDWQIIKKQNLAQIMHFNSNLQNNQI